MIWIAALLGPPLVGVFLAGAGGHRWGRWSCLAVGWALLGTTIAAALRVAALGTQAAGFFQLDALSALFLLPVGILGAAAATAVWRSDPQPRDRAFYALFPAFLTAMAAVAVAGNLIFLWVALELTTVSGVLLVDHAGTRSSVEAAWKFVLLTGAGSLVSLLALGFLLGAAPVADPDWSALLRQAPAMRPDLLAAAFLLALVGFGAKIGLFPLHPWLPDAHSEAPAPVSALLSGAELNLAVYALWRYLLLARPVLGAFSGDLLLAAGLVSAGAGALMLLVSRDLKRLLAYSTLENMGVIVFGLGLGGLLGAGAALAQMLYHSLAKGSLFLSAGLITEEGGSRDLSALTGALGRSPVAAAVLLLAGFAAAGSPPFGNFLGELGILAAAFAASPALAAALLAVLLLVFVGLIHRLTRLVFGPGAPRRRRASPWPYAGALLAAAALLAMSLHLPTSLLELLRQGARLAG